MTDKTEVSDCYMMLPLEFWRLAKINDGRAVLYFTEQQYREVRNALRQYPRFESLSAEVEALKAERDRLRAMVPKPCDGKEQLAFEAFATTEKMDMREHPMHYLFLNPQTGAARKGWSAAIRYFSAVMLQPPKESSNG